MLDVEGGILLGYGADNNPLQKEKKTMKGLPYMRLFVDIRLY